MLQMTWTEQKVTGSMVVTSIPDEKPTKTEAGHFGITGTASERSITLALNHMLTVSGTISGESMTLNFPDRDTGAIEQITFKPGTVEEYNKLADDVRQRANRALAAELKDEADRDRIRADVQTRTDLDTAAGKVATAYQSLTTALGKKQDFSDLDQSLADAKEALERAQGHAATAKSTGRDADGNGCYEASNAAYEASNVEYEAGNVSYGRGVLDDIVAGWADDLKTLESAHGTYQKLQTALPNYKPLKVSSAQLTAVETKVGQETQALLGKGGKYQINVDGLLKTANAAAKAADNAAC
ncbi:hypothetical protein OHA27_23735 [Streptomyces sp. NBC_01619]|uniref:hypothetical protein n=1 Tax=Streptomyces sp. NBC_01619 TaxID=2975901 RepID=UPI00225BF457|nr:hypothetical protein [Streptomyces sp. NBC_01619]MCX4513274.1 hypothetical protein [Streptomyces sp. NBC_01619]